MDTSFVTHYSTICLATSLQVRIFLLLSELLAVALLFKALRGHFKRFLLGIDEFWGVFAVVLFILIVSIVIILVNFLLTLLLYHFIVAGIL